LLGLRLHDHDLGRITVITGSVNVGEQIDALWHERRSDLDSLMSWEWGKIVADMREAFTVCFDESPVAIWASKTGSCVQLEGQPYYRLDYLEVDPDRRGDGLTSPLLFGMIAKRATEHHASGIVLAAFPSEKLVKFYESLGATRGAPRGWTHEPELVPLTFGQEALSKLRELIDAYEENSGRTPT
jgi:GNAT superfamily N-acetyltransferase